MVYLFKKEYKGVTQAILAQQKKNLSLNDVIDECMKGI